MILFCLFFVALPCLDFGSKWKLESLGPNLLNRFNKLGPKLFSDCQTCSVKGRRINDSINTLKDIIDDANIKMLEVFIISIYQSKAFDRMSHKYLFYLLDYVKFGHFLINCIKRICKNSYTCFNQILSKIKIIIKKALNRAVRYQCSYTRWELRNF